MRALNRPVPILPVTSMQTYAIRTPTRTHHRPATCAEIGCPEYLQGWVTVLPTGSDNVLFLRKGAAGRIDGYVRRFTVTHDGGMSTFRFEAGQRCWQTTKHTVRVDRPEIYIARGGDWRGSTGLIRRYDRSDQWVDDFASHQDRVKQRFG